MYDMNGSTVFSKQDMRSGFHQIELDVDSREITTFITHQGLYVYKRLMFGLASAPEMYQKIIRDVLIGFSKACNIADDIVVHDEMLEKNLTRLRECGLTLNGKKCVFRTHKITFFGHDLTDEGVRLNEEKIAVVVNTEVQIDGRPRRLSFFPGDKVVRFTGPYGRPSLSVNFFRYILFSCELSAVK